MEIYIWGWLAGCGGWFASQALGWGLTKAVLLGFPWPQELHKPKMIRLKPDLQRSVHEYEVAVAASEPEFARCAGKNTFGRMRQAGQKLPKNKAMTAIGTTPDIRRAIVPRRPGSFFRLSLTIHLNTCLLAYALQCYVAARSCHRPCHVRCGWAGAGSWSLSALAGAPATPAILPFLFPYLSYPTAMDSLGR